MFYRPAEGHGLPHNPFNAIVAPRPIAWIGTRGRLGDNLAPYSFFNAVAYVPPQVIFASTSAKADREGSKDSVAQIRESGVFSVSLVPLGMIAAMNASSAPFAAGVDEFGAAGVAKADCETIDCPRVATSYDGVDGSSPQRHRNVRCWQCHRPTQEREPSTWRLQHSGLIWPSRYFSSTAPMPEAGSFFVSGCGATRCWSSWPVCRAVLWAWKPAAPRITGRGKSLRSVMTFG